MSHWAESKTHQKPIEIRVDQKEAVLIVTEAIRTDYGARNSLFREFAYQNFFSWTENWSIFQFLAADGKAARHIRLNMGHLIVRLGRLVSAKLSILKPSMAARK